MQFNLFTIHKFNTKEAFHFAIGLFLNIKFFKLLILVNTLESNLISKLPLKSSQKILVKFSNIVLFKYVIWLFAKDNVSKLDKREKASSILLKRFDEISNTFKEGKPLKTSSPVKFSIRFWAKRKSFILGKFWKALADFNWFDAMYKNSKLDKFAKTFELKLNEYKIKKNFFLFKLNNILIEK